MLDTSHHGSFPSRGVGRSSRKNFIQCGQCTEFYSRFTIACPRCSRVNDRSPFVFGIKFLVLAIFVCTVNWVVQTAGNHGSAPKPESVTVVPPPVTSVTSVVNQQDVRF